MLFLTKSTGLLLFNDQLALTGWNITLFWQVESSDLIAYGLIPEFVGRFPIIVSLSALTENQLIQVGYTQEAV